MASPSPVAPVGASFRDIFGTAEMGRPPSALAGAAIDLHIIYKVGFSHGFPILIAADKPAAREKRVAVLPLPPCYPSSASMASLMRPKISSMEPMPFIATRFPSFT